MAGEPVSPCPPARWTAWLRVALAEAGVARLPFHLVRTERTRAIVRVAAPDLSLSRRAWDGTHAPGPGLTLRTARTWGTLVGAKRWIGQGP